MTKNRHIGLLLIGIILFSGCRLYTMRPVSGKRGMNFDRRDLTQIPPEALTDTTLASLSLFGNQLTTLSDSITRLQQLEVLYLGRNQFSTFPEQLCKLKSLRVLSLAYNELDSIPDCLCEMQNLEWIFLNNNQLVHLPDSIGKLQKLEQLLLKQNKLTKLPESLYDLSKLQVLDLGYNELSQLDSGLASLHQLKELRIYRAGFLINVPESICSLRFLERLVIDNSVVLPTCIFARQTNRLMIQSTDL